MNTINLDLLYSKEGEIESCKINNQSLHSKYAPHKEALRVFTKQNLDVVKTQTRIVLIGAALHYDIQAIRTLSPSAKIIAVYFHKELAAHSNADIALYYDTNTTTQHAFLPQLKKALDQSFQLLSNPSHTDIAVCYWPTSMRIWQQHFQQCLHDVKETLLLHSSETNTIRHFLPQWIRNACYHFLHIQSYASITAETKPIVLVAAGHSLNAFLSKIQSIRKNICLVALSSSLHCLHSHGIIPDIVVHQDASYYAQRQLHYYFDKKASLLAMPLSAGRLHIASDIAPILINTHQEMEQLLSFNEGMSVPAYATVLGTAIDICSTLSSHELILVGADMSIDCASAHCIPHCNADVHSTHYTYSREHMLLQEYLQSHHTLSQKRFGYPLKQNNALKQYAQWFSRWKNNSKHRLLHILPEKESSLLGLHTASSFPQSLYTTTDSQKNKNLQVTYTSRNTTFTERVHILQKHIAQWEHASQHIQQTTALLSPMKEFPSSSLQTLIKDITHYIGKERWDTLLTHIKHSLSSAKFNNTLSPT